MEWLQNYSTHISLDTGETRLLFPGKKGYGKVFADRGARGADQLSGSVPYTRGVLQTVRERELLYL